MITLNCCNQILYISKDEDKIVKVHQLIQNEWHLDEKDYYLVCNGKRLISGHIDDGSFLHIVPRLPGGKGGFGSMLRAIGAQIEKTTNREACRDLSGRRLRDINEEKRLKAWIDQQATREQEAADRRQKKLERLCEKPKHEFKDDQYFKEKSELPSRLEDAVEQGLNASASTSTNNKRKSDAEDKKKIKKKKHSLWVEDGLEDLSSSDSDNSENSDSEDNKVESEVSSGIKEKEIEKSGDIKDVPEIEVDKKEDTKTKQEKEIEKSGDIKDGPEIEVGNKEDIKTKEENKEKEIKKSGDIKDGPDIELDNKEDIKTK